MLSLKDFKTKEISDLKKIRGGAEREWVMSIETDTGCYDLYDDGSLEGPPVSESGER